jgi:hypothetical protein
MPVKVLVVSGGKPCNVSLPGSIHALQFDHLKQRDLQRALLQTFTLLLVAQSRVMHPSNPE